MESLVLLVIAGLGAGALNAVAGGGTFLSFPALVWIGLPPVMANATATFAALPGYVGSAWAFRREVRRDGPLALRAIVLMAILGGFLGALLLLVTPKELFSGLVPWLLLFATLAFGAGPTMVRRILRQGQGQGHGQGRGRGQGRGLARWPALALLLAVSIYGGYFNGGLGIMLLAAFGFTGFDNLHEMNGLKNLISAILSLVSVTTYGVAGLIDMQSGLVLGVACAVGGYLGAQLARRITNMLALRIFITLVGLGMAIAFFAL